MAPEGQDDHQGHHQDHQDQPVDGFSVERRGEVVVLTLSNRYGLAEVYWFPAEDAVRIGQMMVLLGG